MIWDRFDDAHDDVLKDIRQIERDIEVLKGRLTTAGIAYSPFKPPESSGESGPQGWYQNTVLEENALTAYRTYLRTLLDQPKSD